MTLYLIVDERPNKTGTRKVECHRNMALKRILVLPYRSPMFDCRRSWTQPSLASHSGRRLCPIGTGGLLLALSPPFTRTTAEDDVTGRYTPQSVPPWTSRPHDTSVGT